MGRVSPGVEGDSPRWGSTNGPVLFYSGWRDTLFLRRQDVPKDGLSRRVPGTARRGILKDVSRRRLRVTFTKRSRLMKGSLDPREAYRVLSTSGWGSMSGRVPGSRRHVSNPHDSVLNTERDFTLSSAMRVSWIPSFFTHNSPTRILVSHGVRCSGQVFPTSDGGTVSETDSLWTSDLAECFRCPYTTGTNPLGVYRVLSQTILPGEGGGSGRRRLVRTLTLYYVLSTYRIIHG